MWPADHVLSLNKNSYNSRISLLSDASYLQKDWKTETVRNYNFSHFSNMSEVQNEWGVEPQRILESGIQKVRICSFQVLGWSEILGFWGTYTVKWIYKFLQYCFPTFIDIGKTLV